MTCDLRRLRLHGMIERIPKAHRYRVTEFEQRAALFLRSITEDGTSALGALIRGLREGQPLSRRPTRLVRLAPWSIPPISVLAPHGRLWRH
jgi:hypothetical protein